MTRASQKQRNPGAIHPRSIWMRLLTVLCLAVVCVASTAQVCHTHVELSPSQRDASPARDSRQNAPAPDHCPLCVAMHSALPAETHHAPEPVLQVQPVLSGAARIARFQQWSFDLFSRPPPALPSPA